MMVLARPCLVCLPLFLMMVACYPARRQVEGILGTAGQIMDDRPDSALSLLRGLDTVAINSRVDKARAALLHQMALDKCYIDITSDSILSPAIQWFIRHGTADQKLQTWYYRSVLARNAKDFDQQMAYLIEAERYIEKANDPLMAGRLYTAKYVNFLNIYSLSDSAIAAEKAVAAFLQAGDRTRYHNAIINLANIYDILGRDAEVQPLLDTLRSHWDVLTIRQQRQTDAITLASLENDPVRRLSLLEEYLERVPDKEINWTVVAETYLECHLPQKAEEAIIQAPGFLKDDVEAIAYYLVRSRVMEALGRHEEALEAYHRYSELAEVKIKRGLSSDSRFLLEKQAGQEHLEKDKKHIIGLLFLIAIIVCIAGYVINRYRQIIQIRKAEAGLLMNELEHNQELIEKEKKSAREAKEEASRLNALLLNTESSRESDAWTVERIDLLNRITALYLTPLGVSARRERIGNLLQAEDRTQLSKDLDQQFAYVHPEFHAFLNQKRLTQRERICCILLCLGLNGKDIASFIGIKEWSCYNLFVTIRSKLGLKDVKINLSTELKEKMHQYDKRRL